MLGQVAEPCGSRTGLDGARLGQMASASAGSARFEHKPSVTVVCAPITTIFFWWDFNFVVVFLMYYVFCVYISLKSIFTMFRSLGMVKQRIFFLLYLGYSAWLNIKVI